MLIGFGLGFLVALQLGPMALLASGVALARRTIGPRAAVVADVLAGVGLLGFGGVLGYRTAADA